MPSSWVPANYAGDLEEQSVSFSFCNVQRNEQIEWGGVNQVLLEET